MQALATVRKWQFDQLRRSVSIVRFIVQKSTVEEMRTYRDGGDGWTVLEVLGHLRDYEGIIHERARLTAEQDQPDLPNADPDQLARDNAYNQQDVNRVMESWSKQRAHFLAFLEAQPEDAWERVGNHSRRGQMTLMDQLLLTVWHDNNHINQMVHILAEKKS